jgi:hypothetical protein
LITSRNPVKGEEEYGEGRREDQERGDLDMVNNFEQMRGTL